MLLLASNYCCELVPVNPWSYLPFIWKPNNMNPLRLFMWAPWLMCVSRKITLSVPKSFLLHSCNFKLSLPSIKCNNEYLTGQDLHVCYPSLAECHGPQNTAACFWPSESPVASGRHTYFWGHKHHLHHSIGSLWLPMLMVIASHTHLSMT